MGTGLLELPDQWLSEITDAVVHRIDERERWVTADGLADWMGCELSHIYDLRERGLPGHRLNNGKPSKKLYFNLGEVSAWFAAISR